jgi:transcription elongation factor Elf1
METCPKCRKEALSPTSLEAKVNVGAYYVCRACGTPVNQDGTENEVWVNQKDGESDWPYDEEGELK